MKRLPLIAVFLLASIAIAFAQVAQANGDDRAKPSRCWDESTGGPDRNVCAENCGG